MRNRESKSPLILLITYGTGDRIGKPPGIGHRASGTRHPALGTAGTPHRVQPSRGPLGALLGHLGPSSTIFGPSSGPVGAILGSLGPSWGHLEAIWGSIKGKVCIISFASPRGNSGQRPLSDNERCSGSRRPLISTASTY